MTTWSTGQLVYFLVVGWQLAADNLVCTATAEWWAGSQAGQGDDLEDSTLNDY